MNAKSHTYKWIKAECDLFLSYAVPLPVFGRFNNSSIKEIVRHHLFHCFCRLRTLRQWLEKGGPYKETNSVRHVQAFRPLAFTSAKKGRWRNTKTDRGSYELKLDKMRWHLRPEDCTARSRDVSGYNTSASLHVHILPIAWLTDRLGEKLFRRFEQFFFSFAENWKKTTFVVI